MSTCLGDMGATDQPGHRNTTRRACRTRSRLRKFNNELFGMSKLDPAIGAALFLLLEQQGVHPDWEGWPSSEAEILALTGADRGEAHEAYRRLWEVLPAVVEQSKLDPPVVCLRHAVDGFLHSNPDAIREVDGQRVYSDEFRDYIAAIRDPEELGESISPEEVAHAAGISLDLYQEWVRQRSQ